MASKSKKRSKKKKRQSNTFLLAFKSLSIKLKKLREKAKKKTKKINKKVHKKLKKLNKKLGKALHPKDKRVWIPRIIGLVSVVVLVIGVTLALSEQVSNDRANNYAKKEVALANEGKPSAAPATIKPSASAVASYNVAPNVPKYLIIPAINVDARIYPVGLTSGGAIGVPSNVYDTDWYNGSSLPGQPGATVIDGHVSSWTAHGVFYSIKTLVPGDTIRVEMGNDTIYTYKVVKSQIYNATNVDMNAVLSPVAAGQSGLNLITCTGDVIPGTNNFDERIAVFAEEV